MNACEIINNEFLTNLGWNAIRNSVNIEDGRSNHYQFKNSVDTYNLYYFKKEKLYWIDKLFNSGTGYSQTIYKGLIESQKEFKRLMEMLQIDSLAITTNL